MAKEGLLEDVQRYATKALDFVRKRGKNIASGDDKVFFSALRCDLLPYSCYYNKDTVLTKNGELLQTLKLSDFYNGTQDTEHDASLTLREQIRKSIIQNVDSNDFSVWVHTIRDKKAIELNDSGFEGFVKDLDESYSEIYGTKEDYFNEIYLTVVVAGMGGWLSMFSIVRSLYFSYVRRATEKYLVSMHSRLQQVTDGILQDLSLFGAEKLSLKKSDKGIIAEHIGFFYYLLNFRDREFYVSEDNISSVLANREAVACGFNTLEFKERGVLDAGKKTKEDKHLFEAMLILKDYSEISVEKLDMLLHVKRRITITQSCSFVNDDSVLNHFKEYSNTLDISKSDVLAKDITLELIRKAMKSSDKDTLLSEHLITISISEDSKDELENAVSEVVLALYAIGFVAYRADIRLEQLFWSRFPANFQFIAKKYPILTEQLAGLASLHSFPAGIMYGGRWGHAVAMFRSAQDNYYFFNFHSRQGDNGHVCIASDSMQECISLTNFLVSNATKFDIRTFYFDANLSSEVFLNAIGKKYSSVLSVFNPLLMEDTADNNKLLKETIIRMRGPSEDKAYMQKLDSTVDKVVAYIRENKITSFREVGKFLELLEGDISEWYGDEGRLSAIFDNAKGVDWDSEIAGVDLTDIYDDSIAVTATLHYLINRLEKSLDGKPTIIVLNFAWKMVSAFMNEEKFKDWLERMSKMNVVVIMTVELSETLQSAKKFFNCMLENSATNIFFPFSRALKGQKSSLDLPKEDLDTVMSMVKHNNNFFMKHGKESLVIKMKLSDIKEYGALYSTPETVGLMKKSIKDSGEGYAQWSPAFFSALG